MSGENQIILNVNGYECYMCYGISDHKSYLMNDCLNEYTTGRYGLLRVLAIGIYGVNFISALGIFIPYYIKKNFDFVEDMFIDAEIDYETEESKKINMKVIITTKKSFGIKREIELNTTLVKLFTNQMLKKINDSECDVSRIDFEIFHKTKKMILEDYKCKLLKENVSDDFDFFVRGMNFHQYLKDHLNILNKCNYLENFMKIELKNYSDIRDFFMTDDLLDDFEKYEQNCIDLFEKIKKNDNIIIQKNEFL